MAKLYSLFEQVREFTTTISLAAEVVQTAYGEDSVMYQQVLALH